ncbi:hypothetical protein KI688_012352 [Linnemannia hyalina]|uniref:Uncharacterized protein n=1 Tax=Linnemannia hyalina TaxID=64524 RepID=A0A9P7XVW0_9FUNG|nr:hypothetical protein KI688_012352 [Linnemannia hyalina]
MRITKSIFLAAFFLAVVQSQQAEQHANQAAFEAHQQPTTTHQDQRSKSNAEPKQQQQQQDQRQPLGAPPQELTPEEFEMAKDGIRQILGQLPIQHVEPLVNTMEGYCSTFGALCTAACKERMTDDDDEEEVQGSTRMKGLSLGCADHQALTIGTAGASCQCASYDMTDRINFAIVGGIVTSHRKESGGFGAEGILDAIQFLPAVPTFLSIIHVLQSICYYVSFLDVLATNANPSSCPANGKAGGILGTITNLVPGLGGILSNVPALGGLLGGLLGTGGGSGPAPTPTPTPTPSPTSGGGFGDFFRGIFGGGGSTSSTTTPAPTTTTPISTTTTTTTITTTTTAAGGIWGFFGNIFGGGATTATTTATKTTIAPTTTATAQVKAPPGATTTPPVAAMDTGGGAKGQTGLPFATATATTIISTTASSSSPSPAPTPKKDGTLFGWFPTFGLLSEVNENDSLIDTDDNVDALGGNDRVSMDVDDDAQNERQLISNDGRLARIVRVQRRYAEKKSREQQQQQQEQQGRRDDL